jgi:hypothetical protein
LILINPLGGIHPIARRGATGRVALDQVIDCTELEHGGIETGPSVGGSLLSLLESQTADSKAYLVLICLALQ